MRLDLEPKAAGQVRKGNTMLVYHTTNSDSALAILKHGFRDPEDHYRPSPNSEIPGVLFGDRPLEVTNCVVGDTVLSLEVSEDVFSQFECVEEGQGYRWALIQVGQANAFGRPKVHGHDFAGRSRRDLVRAAEMWEAAGRPQYAAPMRKAIRFFDEVGWQNVTEIREMST
jgi:hypothetical protein